MRRASPLLLVLLLAAAAPLSAATITIINKDSSGQGLNDPTPATPVGGNPGTTIGQQRLNVFNRAAQIWGQILSSNVEIKVDASFAPLSCTETSGVLGGAGPTTVVSDFANAPLPVTWYVIALADKLAGQEQDPTTSDISAQFNSKLGESGCLSSSPFYYGFDALPVNDLRISFLTVALHEFAHGLGFLSLVDTSTGALFQNQPDVYSDFILDTTAGKTWAQMSSDSDRLTSVTNTGHVVWSGASANTAAANYLSPEPMLYVTSPPAVSGSYTVGTANFGGTITQAGVSGTLVAATDPIEPGAGGSSGGTATDGCSALTNPAQVAGHIALVDRGYCNFTVKATNAQAAGAIAIVIANNVSGGVVQMGGTAPTVTIPVISISQADGASLRASLPAQARIALDSVRRAGMDTAGHVLLYAPNPVESGSSISHFDTSCQPNLLMEPNISPDLPIGVDITPDLFRDLGWFGGASASNDYYVPSVAHSAGGTPSAPAFYTSDLFAANRGAMDANVTFKFLGHDQDGTAGAEQSVIIPAGETVTYRDVLASLFGLTSGNNYGAIRIASDSAALKISSVTTTPTPDGKGAYGQSVPAVAASQLITSGSPGAIVGVREDSVGRTNLVLVNTTTQPLEADATLWDDSGNNLGTLKTSLPALGMTQIGRIVQAITGARNTSNGTLTLSTPTAGGAFTTFASLVDNGTNDPATLFPSTGLGGSGTTSLLVGSTARAAGGTVAVPAFYTSDLFVANVGSSPASYTLKYLQLNTADGTAGPTASYTLNAQTAATFRDVLNSVFGLASNADVGAILVSASTPGIVAGSVTTTPAPAGASGRYGQSVPGLPSTQWTGQGAMAAIVGLREDATARANLVLVSGTSSSSIDVNYALYADGGTQIGTTQTVTLPPLGMTQLNRVISNKFTSASTSNATLVLWTTTGGGTFTGFASLVNNVTNDPATLLPQ